MPKPVKFIIPLVIVAAAVAYWWLGRHRNDDPDRIKLSGNIEVTQVDLAFKIAGRLIQREVDEGQFVSAGQKIAHLDDSDFELHVAQAQAQVDLAQAALAELEAGSRPEEIAQAQAAQAQASAAARASRTRLELANQDLKRNRTLYAGRMSYISDSAEFTPKTVQTDEERVKLMYRVKIELANPDGELKPGMPADAWIQTRHTETQSKP